MEKTMAAKKIHFNYEKAIEKERNKNKKKEKKEEKKKKTASQGYFYCIYYM